MIRRFSKTLYACAYSWFRAAGRSSFEPARSLPFIVGYHRIVENFESSARHAIPSLLTSSAMLESHLDCLARQFEFVSLDDIGKYLESDRTFKRPVAAVTFDDGYSDNYRCALPILKRKGIPGAVFVVTDLVGTTKIQIYDKLFLLLSRLQERNASVNPVLSKILVSVGVRREQLDCFQPRDARPLHLMTLLLTRLSRLQIQQTMSALEEEARVEQTALDEMAPLSWEMIREMHRNGITIGSHTMSHALLNQETANRTQEELLGSKSVLEEKLGSKVDHFAYPDGRFNPDVVDAVRSAGYRYGYGICRTRDVRHPLLTIPRKVLWERACVNAFGKFSPAVMKCHTNWAFEGSRRCSHDHGVVDQCQVQRITA
jgi:peptidoglycan/xylan/chitin deacetylase (PgdA/CDA1 family)